MCTPSLCFLAAFTFVETATTADPKARTSSLALHMHNEMTRVPAAFAIEICDKVSSDQTPFVRPSVRETLIERNVVIYVRPSVGTFQPSISTPKTITRQQQIGKNEERDGRTDGEKIGEWKPLSGTEGLLPYTLAALRVRLLELYEGTARASDCLLPPPPLLPFSPLSNICNNTSACVFPERRTEVCQLGAHYSFIILVR